MAVALEFISIIIPIQNIEIYFPFQDWEKSTFGNQNVQKKENQLYGFNGFLNYQKQHIGKAMWHDDFLFRTGAMAPQHITGMIDEWQKRGLSPMIEVNGKNIGKIYVS